MIDAERLLGKVLSGAMSGTGKRRKRKNRKSDDLVGGLLGGLTSGKGLVTAIGLGIGAYEILKSKSGTAGAGAVPQQAYSSSAPTPPVPPSPVGVAAAPPPLPSQQSAPPPTNAMPTGESETQSGNDVQDLAVRLIQTMVAAAHADGALDGEEEKRILEKLSQEQGLNSEEKQFLLAQLHQPKTIEELVSGINQPVLAQTMYSLAVATIVIDTPEERQWLDSLADALSLSDNVKRFIEEDL